MFWVFAVINGRLSELFFDRKNGTPVILAHAYVKVSEYKTRREKRMIREDTKKHRFTYRNNCELRNSLHC